MTIIYGGVLIVLVFFSAFFSSAETALLSLSKIRLAHRAKRGHRKAIVLKKTLSKPDEFFSTILIGNNLVNIAAASISTLLVSKWIVRNERLVVLVSTLCTTVVILIFAEVIPKTFAFRASEKLSYLYAYPIRFFKWVFYPFVKAISVLSRAVFKGTPSAADKKEFSPEEVKHFLESEIQLFKYSPETLRIVHEMIDVVQKDIKSVMTPRPDMMALDEGAGLEELRRIILENNVSEIPLYKGNLDNITGILHTENILNGLLSRGRGRLDLRRLASKPIFVSEFSSLNYVLREFKRRGMKMAIIIDEYGATLGHVTINDIFSEIFEELELRRPPVKQLGRNRFLIEGQISVEEVNARLDTDLPERKDYATLSGLFIYHFGKFPESGASITIDRNRLQVKRMGERKIEEILLIILPS